jgi:hypothetical protein
MLEVNGSKYAKQEKQAGVDITLPHIPKELLDQFVTGPITAEAVEAAISKFKKAIIERALGAERVTSDYALREAKREDVANHHNGRSAKTRHGKACQCSSHTTILTLPVHHSQRLESSP